MRLCSNSFGGEMLCSLSGAALRVRSKKRGGLPLRVRSMCCDRQRLGLLRWSARG